MIHPQHLLKLKKEAPHKRQKERIMLNYTNPVTHHTVRIIGIDHGYGNIKTAKTCFRAGVVLYEKNRPLLKMYYSMITVMPAVNSEENVENEAAIEAFLDSF